MPVQSDHHAGPWKYQVWANADPMKKESPWYLYKNYRAMQADDVNKIVVALARTGYGVTVKERTQ
ncbi:MAG TPA: hypothetical protein VIG47_14015 [Gemmatimonadaceae bacterium]|jgi:hypothetical protein